MTLQEAMDRAAQLLRQASAEEVMRVTDPIADDIEALTRLAMYYGEKFDSMRVITEHLVWMGYQLGYRRAMDADPSLPREPF